ncbi:MAG: hypothetical protein ACP5O7_10540 [Phycisphaerae bacterium]
MLTHDEIGFHNVAALEPADGGGLYLRRFPQSVRQSLSPLGQMVSQESAGVELRFVTKAKSFVTVYRSAVNIRNNGAGAFVFALVCSRSLWMAKQKYIVTS